MVGWCSMGTFNDPWRILDHNPTSTRVFHVIAGVEVHPTVHVASALTPRICMTLEKVMFQIRGSINQQPISNAIAGSWWTCRTRWGASVLRWSSQWSDFQLIWLWILCPKNWLDNQRPCLKHAETTSHVHMSIFFCVSQFYQKTHKTHKNKRSP